MKQKHKAWIWTAIFCIYLISTLSIVHALTITHNPTTDVSTTDTASTINWTTDEPATSHVTFGRSLLALNETKSDLTPVAQHSVTLPDLQSNTSYYYFLTSMNTSGFSVVDDNAGNKYLFRTTSAFGAGDANATPEIPAELFLDVDVPEHFNSRSMNLIGKTLPGATVRLYVNKPAQAVGGINYDASTITTASGEFAFARINLPLSQNTIDVVAKLGTKNATKHFTTTIDTETPIVNVSMPSVSNTTSIKIMGKTNEQVTVNIHVDSETSSLTLPSGFFEIPLTLRDETSNHVFLEFVDAAGNSISFEQDIIASSRPPQIYYTNLQFLNPSYAQDVVIKGNVTPGSTVVIFVNDETTPNEAWSTSIVELVKHFGQIVDREFLGFFSEETYSTTAGSDGSFEVEVMLSQKFELGGLEAYPPVTPPPPQVGPTPAGLPPSTQAAAVLSKDQFKNDIVILVISPSGQTATQRGQIVYSKCGTGGDWNIAIGDITPGVVIPEHLRRGISQFGFNMELKWQGPGDQGILHGLPYFAMVPMSPEERAKLAFDPSLLINPNNIVPVCSADQKKCHVVMKLNRINYTQPQLENITYKKLGMKIPLLVEVRYGTDYGGVREERTQRQCVEFNTVLDVEVPPSVIPDTLLKGSISAIDFVVDVINKILRPLIIVTKITFFVCLFSWVVWFVYLVYKNYTCIAGSTDECLEASTKANQIDYYMRWVCDRVFCPAAPTYAIFKNSPQREKIVLENGKLGEIDACKEVREDQSKFYDQEPSELFMPTRSCATLYTFKWDTACVGMNELQRSRCYEAQTNRDEANILRFCGGPLSQAFYAASGMCEGQQEIENYRITRGNKAYQYVKSTNQWCELGAPQTTIREETGEQATTRECMHWLTDEEVARLGLGPSTRRENVVNPTEGFLTAMQCACLPAVNGYLQLWRNILVQIKQCFQTILVTGQGSSGLCRAVLTQYLCDIIFDAISCFSQLFGAGEGARTEARGIPAFLKAMSQSGDEIQTSITERYGRTALYNTLFNERKLMHAICLFAFTGDWDLDLDQALGGLGVVPMKSEGFIYPATRRYMTSNPLQYGRTTYIYHIGAGLVAGDDVNYRLQLVCSNDNSCDPDEFRAGGECDCYGKPAPQYYDITREMGSGRLSAGNIAQGDVYANVPDSPIRYDKVRLVWNSVRNVTGRGAPSGEKVVDIRREGGKPPADCTFDVGSLEFRCGFDIGDRGYAIFAQEPVSMKAPVSPTTGLVAAGAVPFGLNEPLRLRIVVDKRSPNFDPQSQDQNKRNPDNEWPFYLRYTVRTPRGFIATGMRDIPTSGLFYVPIVSDGTLELTDRPSLVIKREHFLAGGTLPREITTRTMPNTVELILSDASPISPPTGTTTTRFAIKFADTVTGSSIAYEVFDVDANNNLQGTPIMTGSYTTIGDPIVIPQKNFRITPSAASVDDLKKRAIIVLYAPTAPGVGTVADNCVAHASSPEQWYVHLDLVYPQQIGDTPLTRRSAQPSTEVVVFNGEKQEKEIQVNVVCSETPGSQAGNQCAVDKKLNAICQCGVDMSNLANPLPLFCGGIGQGDYCKLTIYGGQCLQYKICGVKNTFGTSPASRQPVTELCDCDGDQAMECPEDAFCEQQTSAASTVFKCDSAITVAGTTATKGP
ncbi:fibronectin type III domain-containing protein [Candidatus Woesearchaeota archaeon]|nr:fibronectin type III domain-containing protein [Candidatus Woesearchaeota archaeon]